MIADPTRIPPERRRVLIIGAGPTGMSLAFHLGEHSLLLERRDSLENHYDYSHDLPMGFAHGSAMGDEDISADGDGPAPPAENKARGISCNTRTQPNARDYTLSHFERWRPPDFAPPVRTLRPLLRGELRLGANVVRVSPSAHRLELADGHRYVYDKLVSTLTLPDIAFLVAADLPRNVRGDESLRYWLSENDIEVADRAIQDHYGDLDGFAMGKRLAELIGHSLAAKFGTAGGAKVRGTRLFEPRLVTV